MKLALRRGVEIDATLTFDSMDEYREWIRNTDEGKGGGGRRDAIVPLGAVLLEDVSTSDNRGKSTRSITFKLANTLIVAEVIEQVGKD